MKISSWANVVYKDILWLADAKRNGLFKLNLDTMKTVFVTHFDQIPMNGVDMHNEIYVYKDKLIITPCNLNCFLLYDIKNGYVEYAWIDESIKPPFSRSVMIQQKIYLLSNEGHVLCFDCQTQGISEIGKFNEIAKSCIERDDFNNVTSSNETLLVRSAKNNGVYAYYPDRGIVNKIDIGTSLDDVCIMYIYDGLIWITYYDKQSISVWDISKQRLEEYKVDTEKWIVDNPYRAYSRILFDDKVYLVNYNAACPIIVDEERKGLKELSLGNMTKTDESNKWTPLYSNVLRWKDKLIFIPQLAEEFSIYDINTKKVDKVSAYAEYDKSEFMTKSYKQGDLLLRETESDDLNCFIKSINEVV